MSRLDLTNPQEINQEDVRGRLSSARQHCLGGVWKLQEVQEALLGGLVRGLKSRTGVIQEDRRLAQVASSLEDSRGTILGLLIFHSRQVCLTGSETRPLQLSSVCLTRSEKPIVMAASDTN